MEKRYPAFFGIITLVFLCAGAFSPGWFVIDTAKLFENLGHDTSDGIVMHMGLFYFVAVGKDFRIVAGYGDFNSSSMLSMYFYVLFLILVG